ncbi:MAG: platelet-activating factor acetylhydrolase IB subunit [Phycisphaerales bacterium]
MKQRFTIKIFVAAMLVIGPAVAIAHATQRQEQETHSAITRADREAGWWQARHEAMNTRVAQGNVDLIFIGDSITQAWEGNGKAVWDQYYGSRNAVNLGIGGDRTQHVLWRLDHGNIDGISPKAAVIMIGTNNSNGQDNTVAEIADGIRAIVGKLRTEFPEMELVLLDIFPRGANPNPQRGKILQVNQIVRKLANRDEKVHYLAIGHHFVEDDGTISKAIMPDSLHLSPAGYQIWADAIEGKLRELMGAR